MRQTYYSNGKLLLTGEYVILDGALSLAIPTKYVQSLIVEPIDEPILIWKSFDESDSVWFEGEFRLENKMLKQVQHDNEISNRLFQILNVAKQLNPTFLNDQRGFKVETKLTFPRTWGLGSSSTLVNNIANWAKVDAYNLLELTFGGSGYDIACAQYNSAITYQLKTSLDRAESEKRKIAQVDFNPELKDSLYFVYLNKKQNSRDGIESYKKYKYNLANEISEINAITSKIIDCKHLKEFEVLINLHETIISSIIKQETVKNQLFKDFKGSVKSLGAWGGDFVMATSREDPTAYFKTKGFEIIIPFDQMVLK